MITRKLVYVMSLEELRQNIRRLCIEIREYDESKKPIIKIPEGATGSAAGLPFESWFKNEMSGRMTKYKVFGRIEFIKYVIQNFLKNRGLDELHEITWWARLQQFSAENVRRIQIGEEPKLQQALGDIVIKYGDDLNDIVLINVKATEVSDGKPVGRPPNIVSAFRLLEFFLEIFEEKPHLADKVNTWLVGFYYNPIGNGRVRIVNCHFINMFKLDLEKAPEINFDAAIQIQWHVGDMIEREDQTLEMFAQKLADKYWTEWKAFTKRRDEKLEGIIQSLMSAIKKARTQKRVSNFYSAR
jgi:hypothetical protein